VKCRVCNELLANSDRVINHRVRKGIYVKVKTKYLDILNVKARSKHYVFHEKCSRAYRGAERILTSAGLTTKYVDKRNMKAFWEKLQRKITTNSIYGKFGVNQLDFASQYMGNFDINRNSVFPNLTVMKNRSADKNHPANIIGRRAPLPNIIGRTNSILIMDDPYVEPASPGIAEAMRKKSEEWYDKAFPIKATSTWDENPVTGEALIADIRRAADSIRAMGSDTIDSMRYLPIIDYPAPLMMNFESTDRSFKVEGTLNVKFEGEMDLLKIQNMSKGETSGEN